MYLHFFYIYSEEIFFKWTKGNKFVPALIRTQHDFHGSLMICAVSLHDFFCNVGKDSLVIEAILENYF